MPRPFHALITDLDNTLYDWYGFFVPAFYAMVSEASKILDCDEDDLTKSMKLVHQRYGDLEHPFSLIEAPIVQTKLRGMPRAEKVRFLDSAFHVFNQVRKDRLSLFPTVSESLQKLKQKGITIVGHTDSRSLAAVGRLHRLEILDLFDAIYCQSRDSSDHFSAERNQFWNETLSRAPIRELQSHQTKPHKEVLNDILAAEHISRDAVAYVGDSKSRDILMSKSAGVFSAWAEYGAWKDERSYERLIAISHWNQKEIEEEISYGTLAKDISPDLILRHRFEEILPLYE